MLEAMKFIGLVVAIAAAIVAGKAFAGFPEIDRAVGQSWPTPTYALGRYQLDNNGLPMRDKPLITYLIVNICLDLGKAVMN